MLVHRHINKLTSAKNAGVLQAKEKEYTNDSVRNRNLKGYCEWPYANKLKQVK